MHSQLKSALAFGSCTILASLAPARPIKADSAPPDRHLGSTNPQTLLKRPQIRHHGIYWISKRRASRSFSPKDLPRTDRRHPTGKRTTSRPSLAHFPAGRTAVFTAGLHLDRGCSDESEATNGFCAQWLSRLTDRAVKYVNPRRESRSLLGSLVEHHSPLERPRCSGPNGALSTGVEVLGPSRLKAFWAFTG